MRNLDLNEIHKVRIYQGFAFSGLIMTQPLSFSYLKYKATASIFHMQCGACWPKIDACFGISHSEYVMITVLCSGLKV